MQQLDEIDRSVPVGNRTLMICRGKHILIFLPLS